MAPFPPVAVRAHAVAGSVAQSLERGRLFFALDEGPLCGPPLDAANEVSRGALIGPREAKQTPAAIVFAVVWRVRNPAHSADADDLLQAREIRNRLPRVDPAAVEY